MWAVAHPSLPNYLAMISGSTHGCRSNSCARGIRGKTLAGQFARHGLKWRGYFEELPERGYPGDDVGNYVQHHNPFVYFRTITSKPKQRNHILSFRAFRRSLRRPPALSYVVPSDLHNMHSSAIIDGDEWLQKWIPRVMASRGFRHHGAIFITWDEADKTDLTGCCLAGIDGGHQPFVAIVHNGPRHVRLANAPHRLLAPSHHRGRLPVRAPRARCAGPPAREVLLGRGRQPTPFREGSMSP